MPRNVEIKAKARNFALQQQRALERGAASAACLTQEDVFFHTPRGRLKLRVFSEDRGELIYYERGDTLEPKVSDYLIAATPQPHALRAVLEAAWGVRGRVRKVRHVYLSGPVRIHFDEVEELGEFLELEVVLQPGESLEAGYQTAAEWMRGLEIEEPDLVRGAYLDLLEAQKSTKGGDNWEA